MDLIPVKPLAPHDNPMARHVCAVTLALPKHRPPARAAQRRQSVATSTASEQDMWPQPRLRDTLHAVIVRDGDWYVAECAEIAVVTQSHTLDETIADLREAIALRPEGKEAVSLGITPRLVATIELRTGDARLRVLSGRDVVCLLAAFDLRLVATRGSYAKLARERPDGHREALTVPLHSAPAPGTVVAIYRRACRFVSESDLRPFFYTD